MTQEEFLEVFDLTAFTNSCGFSSHFGERNTIYGYSGKGYYLVNLIDGIQVMRLSLEGNDEPKWFRY